LFLLIDTESLTLSKEYHVIKTSTVCNWYEPQTKLGLSPSNDQSSTVLICATRMLFATRYKNGR